MKLPRSILEAAEKANDEWAQSYGGINYAPSDFKEGIYWLFSHLTELASKEFDEDACLEAFSEKDMEGDMGCWGDGSNVSRSQVEAGNKDAKP